MKLSLERIATSFVVVATLGLPVLHGLAYLALGAGEPAALFLSIAGSCCALVAALALAITRQRVAAPVAGGIVAGACVAELFASAGAWTGAATAILLLGPLLGWAVELEEPKRSPFVAKACAGDSGLEARVHALLRAHEEADAKLAGSPGWISGPSRLSVPAMLDDLEAREELLEAYAILEVSSASSWRGKTAAALAELCRSSGQDEDAERWERLSREEP